MIVFEWFVILIRDVRFDLDWMVKCPLSLLRLSLLILCYNLLISSYFAFPSFDLVCVRRQSCDSLFDYDLLYGCNSVDVNSYLNRVYARPSICNEYFSPINCGFQLFLSHLYSFSYTC